MTYTEVLSRQFFKGFSRHRFKSDLKALLCHTAISDFSFSSTFTRQKIKSSYSQLQEPPKHLLFGYENSHLAEKKTNPTTKKSQSCWHSRQTWTSLSLKAVQTTPLSPLFTIWDFPFIRRALMQIWVMPCLIHPFMWKKASTIADRCKLEVIDL